MSTAKQIFLDALDHSAATRQAFIDSACGDDVTLRERVSALLAAHRRADQRIIEPTVHPLAADLFDEPIVHERPGSHIGPYEIEKSIGEGGFGTVYLARQSEPVQRRVALKIIRAGMESHDVIRRFGLERQALAVMDHPGIAKVFDAGETVTGRPYFVMEFVDGLPITEFCDTNRLSITARLELFENVCLALQHAHLKGVVHRDLKPSNVMVTLVDGKPFPKVIDFGIAKAMEAHLEGHASITMPQQIIGTPQYMSPEQAALASTDIDTRADVYSLGAILYELLTGSPVFEASRLKNIKPSELERMICEEDPPRPSIRAMQAGAKLGEIATRRSIDAGRLSRTLAGDLDWICMRALEKDRARRYPTAQTFAADIRRYLNDEIVEASPPTATYRFAKFARRHKVELVAGALVFVSLVAFAGGSAYLAWRESRAAAEAKKQLARANALAEFSQDMLSGVDPAEARGMDTKLLRKILSESVDRVHKQFANEPEPAGSMLNAIGYTYMKIGEFKEAEVHLREAASLLTKALGDDHIHTLQARENLAAVMMETGRYTEAQPLIVDILERRKRVQGEDHGETLLTAGNLGFLYERIGKWDLARQIMEEQLQIRLKKWGEAHESTLTAMNNLANVLDNLGLHKESAELLERAVRGHTQVNGPDHPKTLFSMNNLASSYSDQRRIDEARELYLKVLEIKRRVQGPKHPSTLVTMNNLASLEIDAGNLDAAGTLVTESLAIATEALAPNDLRRISLLNTASKYYRARKQPELAAECIAESVEAAKASMGENHPTLVILQSNLASVRIEAGDLESARAACNAAIATAEKSVGKWHESTILAWRLLARALSMENKYAEAAEMLENALKEMASIDTEKLVELRKDLATFQEKAGNAARAAEIRAVLEKK